MEYINWGIGLFLIGMGVLVYKYPNLISGFNTLTPEQKEKVNVKGLKSFMRMVFIFMGVLIPIDFYILRVMGYPMIADYISFLIIIIGTIYMTVSAGSFFRK